MTNPLLDDWTAPYGLAPYPLIEPEHFPPAFDAALAAHMAEVEAIAANPAPPDFETVVAALERSGELLTRVCSTFFGLTGAHTNDALRRIERETAPRLAKHFGAIYTRRDLFAKVQALVEAGAAGLTHEQTRALERYRLAFVRSGAGLDETGRARMREIKRRLAELTTQFSQNVLADESGYRLVLRREDELAGLPDFVVSSAQAAAEEAGLTGAYVFTLSRSSVGPFLKFSSRRDLREAIHRAFVARGAASNPVVLSEIVSLRRERARLLGYANYAAYSLDDAMAKTPEAASALLNAVWGPAVRRVEEERAMIAAAAQAEGFEGEVEEWDWRFWAERVRRDRFDLNEAELAPYFQLDNMIEAAFFVAGRLFGLRFEERFGLPSYHPDVRAWEVFDADGSAIGLFLGDYFTRPSKSGGAWMRAVRSQERVAGEVKPVIMNVLNLVKPRADEPALMSVSDAETLFHEFGHALHGLLSDVTYPIISGTNVPRDFVELPSQLFEHWLLTPEVLSRFARHAETGQPIPPELVTRLRKARSFNQGFETVQYLASAIVDLDLHTEAPDPLDVDAFEAEALARAGMPPAVGMRHRLPHFLHLFGGDGYAAGYYSYLWSETMDADAFEAFQETGDVFDPETARRLRRHIYSTGGSVDPAEAYAAFRGRQPSHAALLAKRGFA
ncbi:MAG: M3 family metallopeptidase [Hyphomicrobiales bacterium]|nr:M3 family metallopeptidase [Hyphomicrobiales bacterium]